MNPNTACFQNIDPQKNIGKATGKKFAVFFRKRNHTLDSYAVYQDGTTGFLKENTKADLASLMAGVQSGLIVSKRYKDLTW